MDLIEREKVKVAIREKFKTLQERTEINTIINEQPTVDAIPIRWIREWIEKHSTDCDVMEGMLLDWREEGGDDKWT